MMRFDAYRVMSMPVVFTMARMGIENFQARFIFQHSARTRIGIAVRMTYEKASKGPQPTADKPETGCHNLKNCL
jgi:hypothetical protein